MVHLPASGVLFAGDVMMPYLGQPFAGEGSPEGAPGGPRLHRQLAAPPAHPGPHNAHRAVHRRGCPRPPGGTDPAARRGTGRHPPRPHPPGPPGAGQPPGNAPRSPHDGRALPGDPRPLHRAALPPAHRLLAARRAGTRAGDRGRPRPSTPPHSTCWPQAGKSSSPPPPPSSAKAITPSPCRSSSRACCATPAPSPTTRRWLSYSAACEDRMVARGESVSPLIHGRPRRDARHRRGHHTSGQQPVLTRCLPPRRLPPAACRPLPGRVHGRG
jgi:hypothetical protein